MRRCRWTTLRKDTNPKATTTPTTTNNNNNNVLLQHSTTMPRIPNSNINAVDETAAALLVSSNVLPLFHLQCQCWLHFFVFYFSFLLFDSHYNHPAVLCHSSWRKDGKVRILCLPFVPCFASNHTVSLTRLCLPKPGEFPASVLCDAAAGRRYDKTPIQKQQQPRQQQTTTT